MKGGGGGRGWGLDSTTESVDINLSKLQEIVEDRGVWCAVVNGTTKSWTPLRDCWRQEEKGTTEDEMVGWHHWLNGHESEKAPGAGDGQGSLACCCPWGCKESTWLSNWTELGTEQQQPLYWGCGVLTIGLLLPGKSLHSFSSSGLVWEPCDYSRFLLDNPV